MKRLLAALPLALLLTGCGPKPPKTAYPERNDAATLNGQLPWNPRSGRVITTWISPGQSMTTLYGDDMAVNYARSHADGRYPSGAKLGAVTWSQQEDPRWFGGRIPGRIAEVEIVISDGNTGRYTKYQGSPLKPVPGNDPERAQFLLEQRAAVMP